MRSNNLKKLGNSDYVNIRFLLVLISKLILCVVTVLFFYLILLFSDKYILYISSIREKVLNNLNPLS